MIEEKKGCVYFFRHIGLEPVKIGYTNDESPLNRFNQFKTYAPFGAELLGFIRALDAKSLETELHNRYRTNRLKGEWFLVSEKQVEQDIEFYESIEDGRLKNEFQIAWAEKLNDNAQTSIEGYFKQIEGLELKVITNRMFSKFPNSSKTEVAKVMGVSRRTIYRHLKQ